jgi:hypothetical protein
MGLSRLAYSLSEMAETLKMQTVCSSETLLPTYESIRRQNPEEQNHHPHRRKNIKSHIVGLYFVIYKVVGFGSILYVSLQVIAYRYSEKISFSGIFLISVPTVGIEPETA